MHCISSWTDRLIQMSLDFDAHKKTKKEFLHLSGHILQRSFFISVSALHWIALYINSESKSDQNGFTDERKVLETVQVGPSKVVGGNHADAVVGADVVGLAELPVLREKERIQVGRPDEDAQRREIGARRPQTDLSGNRSYQCVWLVFVFNTFNGLITWRNDSGEVDAQVEQLCRIADAHQFGAAGLTIMHRIAPSELNILQKKHLKKKHAQYDEWIILVYLEGNDAVATGEQSSANRSISHARFAQEFVFTGSVNINFLHIWQNDDSIETWI